MSRHQVEGFRAVEVEGLRVGGGGGCQGIRWIQGCGGGGVKSGRGGGSRHQVEGFRAVEVEGLRGGGCQGIRWRGSGLWRWRG